MAQVKTVVTGALIFVGGAGAGFGAAYFLQKKRYEALIDQEIAQVKETYSDPNRKTGIFASPETAAEALITKTETTTVEVDVNPALIPDNATLVAGRSRVQDILREEFYAAPEDGVYDDGDRSAGIELGSEPTAYNLIQRAAEKSEVDIASLDMNKPIEEYAADLSAALGEDASPTGGSIWDPDVMAQNEIDAAAAMPAPDPDNPYVITYEQFMTDDVHKDNKVSVIYYDDDEQLADESGHLVNNVEELVGRDNLEKFGLGSQDRNVVYVRNERMDMDLEIVRDKRSFQSVILGIKTAPERNTTLRMRDDDH